MSVLAQALSDPGPAWLWQAASLLAVVGALVLLIRAWLRQRKR